MLRSLKRSFIRTVLSRFGFRVVLAFPEKLNVYEFQLVQGVWQCDKICLDMDKKYNENNDLENSGIEDRSANELPTYLLMLADECKVANLDVDEVALESVKKSDYVQWAADTKLGLHKDIYEIRFDKLQKVNDAQQYQIYAYKRESLKQLYAVAEDKGWGIEAVYPFAHLLTALLVSRPKVIFFSYSNYIELSFVSVDGALVYQCRFESDFLDLSDMHYRLKLCQETLFESEDLLFTYIGELSSSYQWLNQHFDFDYVYRTDSSEIDVDAKQIHALFIEAILGDGHDA